MTIILTREVAGKKVKLDLITLNGKATVRQSSLKEMKKEGIKQKDLEALGYGIEPTY